MPVRCVRPAFFFIHLNLINRSEPQYLSGFWTIENPVNFSQHFMKTMASILFALLSLNLFGQNLTDKVGEIEVELIQHYFLKKSDLTKKKSSQKNRPFLKLYFDANGNLLKTISFGKQHNTDLGLTDKIKLFNYENGKLTEKIEYESDYQNRIYPYWKSKYIYNEKEELIDESTYYFENDSLHFKTTFEYDKNSNRIKSIFNPTYYYQRDFDSFDRIISLKQIYNGKIRWEWKYAYSENKRFGMFQTYYNDGKEYAKEETQTYDDRGFLIKRVEKYIMQTGLNQKENIYYDKNGIIERIEYFESLNNQKKYSLISHIEVKIKSKVIINHETALKINNEIDID